MKDVPKEYMCMYMYAYTYTYTCTYTYTDSYSYTYTYTYTHIYIIAHLAMESTVMRALILTTDIRNDRMKIIIRTNDIKYENNHSYK